MLCQVNVINLVLSFQNTEVKVSKFVYVFQEEESRKKRLMNEIKITFNDSPRGRGRGGRRGGARGPRGGRGGRGGDRRSANTAPKFDEDDFPSLIKSAA